MISPKNLPKPSAAFRGPAPVLLGLLLGALPCMADLFTVSTANLGTASNYDVLFEGGGSNNTLHYTSDSGTVGNVGIGGTGKVDLSGGTITGSLDFSAAAVNCSNTATCGGTATGGIHTSVSNVTSALNTVNALSSMLNPTNDPGGTSLAINHTTTINGSAGFLDSHGNEVFDVSSFASSNGDVITINGNGHPVVINVGMSTNFDSTVVLNGLTSDQVLWNYYAGANLSGGSALGGTCNGCIIQGTFLNPNGTINFNNITIDGRVFGGDSQDMQIVSLARTNQPTTTSTTPEPTGVALLGGVLVFTALATRRRGRSRLTEPQ